MARSRLVRRGVVALALGAVVLTAMPAAQAHRPPAKPGPPAVVVATFDTGTNPFHPAGAGLA